MSTSLGEMTVAFKANLTDLVQGTQRAQQEIRQVGQTASETGSKMEGGLGSSISSVGSTLGGFTAAINMAVGVIQGFADAAMGVGQAIISVNAPMEQASVTMETLMGSTQAAQGMMKQLWDFAANTPFEFAGVEASAAQLKAVGFSAQDIIPDLTAIGDALSALGQASDADLKGVAVVFGQIHNTGHLMAQDMMQLTDRGIPAWRMLSEQMHISVAQLQNMTSKGLIPADQAISMLVKGMEQAFGGGMQKQSKTFLGLWSTIHDNIESAMRSITGPAFIAAKKGLEDLGNIVSSKSFQAFADMAGKTLAPAFEVIGRDIDSIVKGMQDWLGQQGNLDDFKNTLSAIVQLMSSFRDGALSVAPAIQQTVDTINSMNDALGFLHGGLSDNKSMAYQLGQELAVLVGALYATLDATKIVVNGMIFAWRLFFSDYATQMSAVIDLYNAFAAAMGLPAINKPSTAALLEGGFFGDKGGFGGTSGSSGGSPGSSGSSDTGGTGGIGGTGGTGGSHKHPPKKPPAGSTGPGGNVAPPGASGYGGGIGTGGTGSANNILIVIEIDGQVFASQVVQQVYDQVRLRLGPGGFAKA